MINKDMLERCSFSCDVEKKILYIIPQDYQRVMGELQDLSILFDYHYNEENDSVESFFYSPESLQICILEDYHKIHTDLSIELASRAIADSVNFWHSLGLQVVDSPARPYAWVDLESKNFKVSIRDFIHHKENTFTFSKK